MENIFVEFLPPWIETGLQPAFYDKESGTVLQQTARMYARVNMLIRMFNKLSKNTKTTVEDYINQFNELHDYVHDYFDNLDVQEEINNKLDAMVEDGTLQEIITAYIQANVTWTFDTVADMKLADNLINGSYARTLGFRTVNDGGGALYRITNTGTANEVNIIAVNNSLLANLVYDTVCNIKQFGCYCDNTHDDTTALQTGLNNMPSYVNEVLFDNEYAMLIGGEIALNTLRGINFNFKGKIHHSSSATSKTCFVIINCENLTFNNVSIYSERDQVESAPAGHTRVNEIGSNIIGFLMKGCKNIYFNNSTFQNLSSDFFNREYEGQLNNISNGIFINGWNSTNASGCMFMDYAKNVNIDNAYLVTATNLGNGDHIVYFSNSVDTVNITNSYMASPDTYFGKLLMFYNTGDNASDGNCPKNLKIDNCKFDAKNNGLLTMHFSSNAIIENSEINGDTLNNSITMRDTSNLILRNNEISMTLANTSSYINIEGTDTPTVLVYGNTISGSGGTIFSITTSGNTLVNIYNNKITWNNSLIYVRYSTGTIIIKNNIINQDNVEGFCFSFRNTNGVNMILDNTVINTTNKNNFIYNSNQPNSNNIKCYYNNIIGYTNIANTTDIAYIDYNYNII